MSLAMNVEEREAFLADVRVGVLAVMAGGEQAPLTIPVWYDYRPGGDLTVITRRHSQKAKLIQEAGRFSLCTQDETVPYRYVSVEGHIAAIETVEREEYVEMAARYLGAEVAELYLASSESDEDESIAIRMRPQRWRTADYAKMVDG